MSRDENGNWKWHSPPLSRKCLEHQIAKYYSIRCGALGSRECTWHWVWPLWALMLLCVHGGEGLWSSECGWSFYFQCSTFIVMLTVLCHTYGTWSTPALLPHQTGSPDRVAPLCSHRLAPNRCSKNTCWEKQMTHDTLMASLWASKSFWTVNDHSLIYLKFIFQCDWYHRIPLTLVCVCVCVIASIPRVKEYPLVPIGIMG